MRPTSFFGVLFILLISGSTILANTEIAIIEFREGSTEIDEYVAKQLDRVYKSLPENCSVLLEVVLQREINLYYGKSSNLSCMRCESIAKYYFKKGIDKAYVNVNTYRNRMYLETITYNQLQEFSGQMIFKIKLSQMPQAPLSFTHSGTKALNDQCLTQTIDVSKPNRVRHFNGAEIGIPADAFVSQDQLPLRSNFVDIKVCVYSDKADFLLADLTSNSGKRWLESGGMLYIEAYSGNQKLRLKEGKKIRIHLLEENGKPNGMMVFKGEEKYNLLNWIPDAEDKILRKTGKDTMVVANMFTGETEVIVTYDDDLDFGEYEDAEWEEPEYTEMEGYLMEVSDLGWINCDRFLDIQNPQELMVNIGGDLKNVAVRVVFQNLNSVLPGYELANTGVVRWEQLPKGEPVSILAFGKQNGRTVWSRKDIVIGAALLNIELAEISESELKVEMQKFQN